MDRRSLNGQKKDAKLHDRWMEWVNVDIFDEQKTPVIMNVGEQLRSKHYEGVSTWYGYYIFGKE
jgi:hypothetical protein